MIRDIIRAAADPGGWGGGGGGGGAGGGLGDRAGDWVASHLLKSAKKKN